MFVYEKTRYPDLFKNTYWGRYKFGTEHSTISEEMIENRNKFVEENNVKENCDDSLPEYVREIVNKEKAKLYTDHLEYYKTSNSYLIMSNPYIVHEKDRTKYLKNGWREIYKLYADQALTFIKVVPIREKTNGTKLV